MSLEFEKAFIALIFASQIAVLSFITPNRRLKNYETTLKTYPPAEYPRLYTVSQEVMDRRFALFRPIRFAIGVASTVALAAGLLYTESSAQYGQWMIMCLMAQLLPSYLQLPWLMKRAKAARMMPPPRVRTAELRQWRMSDFVSPLWIGLGVTLQIIALAIAALVYHQQPQTLRLTILCGAISAALLLRMGYLLLGRVAITRTDPYMAVEDNFRQRSFRFAMLFRGGAAFAACEVVLMLYAAHFLRFDFGYLWAALSMIFQALALALVWTQARNLRTYNFNVYRPEPESPVAR